MGDMQLQVDIGLCGHWKRAHLASLGIKKQMNISCKPKGKPSVHDRPSMLRHAHWHYPLRHTHAHTHTRLFSSNVWEDWMALVVYLCCHSNYSIVSKNTKKKKIPKKKNNPNKTERCDPDRPEICSYAHYVTWPFQIQRQEIKHCQHWASWLLLHRQMGKIQKKQNR